MIKINLFRTVKSGLHYTKTNGYIHTHHHKYNYNEYQQEGSPSTSVSKPVQTAALFGNKFPKVEYLSIINDNGYNEAELSIQLPPIPSQLIYIKDEVWIDNYTMILINILFVYIDVTRLNQSRHRWMR